MEKVDFKGTWDGQFVDSLKNEGKGQYEFGEEKEGRFTVKVTWGKGNVMILKGERLGPNTLRLVGEHDGITYRYIGGMEMGDVVLGYVGEEKSGKRHFGVSHLTRQK